VGVGSAVAIFLIQRIINPKEGTVIPARGAD